MCNDALTLLRFQKIYYLRFKIPTNTVFEDYFRAYFLYHALSTPKNSLVYIILFRILYIRKYIYSYIIRF